MTPTIPRRGTSSTCADCAAATPPRPPSRRRSGSVPTEEDWTVDLEREDVCPVATIPAEVGDLDGFLATLGKKERHEIRRKLRRAEAVGDVVLAPSVEPLADLDAFIDLHQRRWGDAGLFPPTPGRRRQPAIHPRSCSRDLGRMVQ